MGISLFNYRLSFEKIDKAKDYYNLERESALAGLLEAEFNLEHVQKLISVTEETEDTARELEGYKNGISHYERAIKSYKTKLEVLDKRENELKRKKVTIAFYEDSPPEIGDTIKVGKLKAEFKE